MTLEEHVTHMLGSLALQLAQKCAENDLLQSELLELKKLKEKQETNV